MHIADHTLDTIIVPTPISIPIPMAITENGKPLAQARKLKGTPTHIVLPAAYNKLVAECDLQKVRILNYVAPNELTVSFDQGELMDDIVHQLGYRVVSMTEFSREKRTIFILEKER